MSTPGLPVEYPWSTPSRLASGTPRVTTHSRAGRCCASRAAGVGLFLRACVHVRLFVCLRVVHIYDVYARIITHLYTRTAAHRRFGPRELRYTLGTLTWFVCLFVGLRVRARRYQTGLSERWFPAEQVGRPASFPSLSFPFTFPCVLSRALPWARVCSFVRVCVSVCVRARVHVCAGAGAHMHCGCVCGCVRVRVCQMCVRGAPIVSRAY